MKLLRVIATVDPRTGGPIEGLIQSSKALADLGHETEIATLDLPTDPWVADSPFKTHALGPRTQAYGYAPKFAPWIRQNQYHYDAVFIHGLWNYTSVGAWLGLRGGPTPYFVFTHGSMDPWHRKAYPLKDLAKQIFWLAFEGRVLRDAKLVLFTTEEERRLARAAYWGHRDFRDKVIAYGTADAPAEVEAQKAAFRAHCELPPSKRFILFLSRIHPKKGLDILIRGFAELAPKYPELDLVVAGPDQIGWASELKALARRLGVAGRVHWPGMLRGDAKWGAYRSASAFALPSHGENFGIVVAEAMACGTPVLITDRVNIWREIEASGGGIIAPDTLPGFMDALSRFCNLTAEQIDRMKSAARAAFLEKFEITAVANELLEVVERP